MNDFGFNDMSDEEFMKEFMKFLNKYQDSLKNSTNKTYNPRGFTSYPFFNIQPISDDMLRYITKNSDDMNTESGTDENGQWEKRSWSSPDGKSSFSSYTRNSFYNPFEGKVKFKDDSEELDTIKLLKENLNKAVIKEDYESAAKIRDLIKSLKED